MPATVSASWWSWRERAYSAPRARSALASLVVMFQPHGLLRRPEVWGPAPTAMRHATTRPRRITSREYGRLRNRRAVRLSGWMLGWSSPARRRPLVCSRPASRRPPLGGPSQGPTACRSLSTPTSRSPWRACSMRLRLRISYGAAQEGTRSVTLPALSRPCLACFREVCWEQLVHVGWFRQSFHASKPWASVGHSARVL